MKYYPFFILVGSQILFKPFKMPLEDMTLKDFGIKESDDYITGEDFVMTFEKVSKTKKRKQKK